MVLYPDILQEDQRVGELCNARPCTPVQVNFTESPVQIVRVFLLADHTRGDAMDGTVGGITHFIVIVAAVKGWL